mmetsp:Transcript_2634/g.6121  ORF Transcript_2634/g.6121 Transcript_2634/m.6121 type:complete len:226 (+) Transcript_2634:518-1195(+)
MLKKYSTSSRPSSGKSVQCTAFSTRFTPYLARRVSGRKCDATSGSIGPTRFRNVSTAFSCRISMTRAGPAASSSTRSWYSGRIPRYTSRNSSARFFSSVHVFMALISNPSSRMRSTIGPMWPADIACGLTIPSVQLLKMAVVGRPAFGPKKRLSSRAAESELSLPCVAFRVPSVPNRARIDAGASSRAVCVLVGPMSDRHVETAFVPISSIATHTSLVMKFTRLS